MPLGMFGDTSFGTVQPLTHQGCWAGCRDLCFERRDPRGLLVRLTHEAWIAKVRKHSLTDPPALAEQVIAYPAEIHRDKEDRKAWLYYSGPSGPGGTMFLVVVKCLPWRMARAWSQRGLRATDLLARRGWGESWVSSAYWVKGPKARGRRIWP